MWTGQSGFSTFIQVNFLLNTCTSSFPDVWLSLNGTTYHNNSIVTLEDIGKEGDALLCKTIQTSCCIHPYTLGNWFFPNETRVSSSGNNFYRDREQMVVRLNRQRGGVEGIYHCEIPDSMDITQIIYIGVYKMDSGE